MHFAAVTIFIFFLLFSFITHKCIADVQCLEDQRDSLLQLKDGLIFRPNQLFSWKPGSNCCDWAEVACDSQSGQVTGLDLSMRNISGTVSVSLLSLTSLRNLNLAYNQFASAPVSLGFERLINLRQLNLSNAGFSGVLPANIFQLRNLKVLDLSGNPMISGILPVFPKDSALRRMVLSNTNVSGKLPGSIGNLRYLRVLDLSSCSFSGVIPDSVGSLPQLHHLDLSFNSFTGQLGEFQIPSASLRTIDFSNNKLQGKIPRSLFNLSSLKFLDLGGNSFGGMFELDAIYSLKNLTHLDLSNNNLSIQESEASSSISGPKISTLKLSSCNLLGVPSFLKYQDRMTTLDLSDNRIAGSIPKWIWSIGNQTLMSLNLSYNLFTHVEGSVSEFSDNSKFSPIILDLRSNRFQGPILLPPRDTILLDYSNNNFSSVIPSNISYYLNSTIFFSVANNRITGEIPLSICSASSIQILDLSDNLLSGQIPSCILQHRNDLIVLNLKGNRLEGSVPRLISKECGLKTISLNSNNLEGELPETLANCGQLEVIDFGNNQLVSPFPWWLGNIYILRILVLRSNGFYGTMELPPQIPHNNYTFTKLQILDLSSNNFSGILPAACFPNLRAMTVKLLPNSSIVGQTAHPQLKQLSEGFFYHDTVLVTSKGQDTNLVKILTIYNYIDLSSNKFEGTIPDIMGQLQSLCVLNLSHNALSGQIPATFGNLSELESLDLSANHLMGKIPQELAALTFLSFLNLSDNNLVGRIPEGNQLSTFTNDSYLGNKGLCGIPLAKQCGNASTVAEFPATDSDQQSSDEKYDLGLALSVGLGFGFGIALVFVIQNLSWRDWMMVRRWFPVQRSRDDSVASDPSQDTTGVALSSYHEFMSSASSGTKPRERK